jgi:PHD/YefM family antitoxin component YafN of YafNO toxin-antitoxin module
MNAIERIKPYEAKRALTRLLNQVAYGHRPVIFETRGHDLAALISMNQLRILQKALALKEDQEDAQEMEAALADPRNAERLSWSKIRNGSAPESRIAAQRGKGIRKPASPRKTARRKSHRRA